MIRLWHRLRAATPADRALTGEALAVLLAARFGLWCLPFTLARRLLGLHARHAPGRTIPVERIAWSLTAVSRRLPEPFQGCLPQALAAEAMLRRHGAPAELRFGARPDGATGAVWAHAWVESGGRPVVGVIEELSSYRPLEPARAVGGRPDRAAPGPEELAGLFRGPHPTWDRVGYHPEPFLEACRAEEATALLYHRMRGTPAFASWPPAVREALEQDARAAVARELLIHRELLCVLEALGARGIRPLLFKGTAMAYSRYPHPSLRSRSDTDLLIRSSDAVAVREVLGALGYAPSLLCDGELLFRQFELARDDEFGVSHALDVHWAISTQAAFADVLPFEELAARAVPAPALGPNAGIPAVADALLLALIHPVMHHRNQQRLLWAYDVHLLAGALGGRGFPGFVRRAADRRVAAVCAHGLRTARDWFGAEVPQEALDHLATIPVRQQPTAAFLAPARSWAHETAANFRALRSWRDRMRLLREITFPSPAFMFRAYGVGDASLGKALLPALYLHRGARGMWRVMSGKK